MSFSKIQVWINDAAKTGLSLSACFMFSLCASPQAIAETPASETIAQVSPNYNLSYKSGKGLGINSSDGAIGIHAGLRFQILGTLENGSDNEDGLQGVTIGATPRRVRLNFKGHVINPLTTYKVQLAYSPKDVDLGSDGALHKHPVLDAYLQFGQLDKMSIRVGQGKVPYSRQQKISSSALQLVDRSIADKQFIVDRDIGVSALADDLGPNARLSYHAGVFVGNGVNTLDSDTAHLLYAGRVELNLLAKSKCGVESDIKRTEGLGLCLGAAVASQRGATRVYSNSGSLLDDGGTSNFTHLTADAALRLRGFSADFAFYQRAGERNAGEGGEGEALTPAASGMGYYLQAGSLLPGRESEISARYGQVRASTESSSITPENELGLGFSHFFSGHPIKVQADYFRLWEEGDVSSGDDRLRLNLQVLL